MFAFVDLYRPTSPPAGWTTMGAIIHKGTEGTGFQDSQYFNRRSQYKGPGFWGAYHAFRGNIDAKAQARYFVAYVDPRPGDVLFLDFEQFAGSWSGRSVATLRKMAKDFMAELHRLCPGNRKGIYCNKSDYDTYIRGAVSVYDGLWLAWYTSVTPGSSYPWLFWQYAVVNNVDWNRAKFADGKAAAVWAHHSASGGISAKDVNEMRSVVAACQLPNGVDVTAVVGSDNRIYTSYDGGPFRPVDTATQRVDPGLSMCPDGTGTADAAGGVVIMATESHGAVIPVRIRDASSVTPRAAVTPPLSIPGATCEGAAGVSLTSDGKFRATLVGTNAADPANGVPAHAIYRATSTGIDENGVIHWGPFARTGGSGAV